MYRGFSSKKCRINKLVEKNIAFEDIEREIFKNLTCDKDYLFLEHKYQGVYVGRYKDGKFHHHDDSDLEKEDMLEIRIFDKDEELHIIKLKKDKYILRFVNDSIIEENSEGDDCFDEECLVFGSSTSIEGKWIVLKDGRGVKIRIPCIEAYGDIDEGTQFNLTVRYYTGFDCNDLMYFKDSRLVKIRPCRIGG